MLDARVLRPERIRKITREEFNDMVAIGMFERENVELLRGELVEMSPASEPHSEISAWLTQILSKRLPFARYDVRSHSAFAAAVDSQPEPDISVSPRRTTHGYPSVALLLVEVALSSLRKDRVIKTEIYAEAGVPEYWIVNVRKQVVEVLTEPTPRGYANRCVLAAGDVLRPGRLPRIRIPVSSIPWYSPEEIADALRRERARRRQQAAKVATAPKTAAKAASGTKLARASKRS